MKNKSLIVILSVLTFIVLIVILSSTIFCLKSVEIAFYSNTINLTGKENEITQSGNFKYNKSIFFINKQNYINVLEQENPYVKVLNLETIFPNKLVINVVERNELFAVKGYNDNSFASYMIIDSELKVLKNEQNFDNSHTNAILIVNENSFFANKDAGQVINSSYDNILKSLSYELLSYNDNYSLLKANFEEITLNYEGENNIKIKMRSGTQIIIKEANIRLSEKFMLALSTYDTLEDKTSGKILTYINNNDEVVGVISK